jgi:anti-sigma-K factor RskA
MARDEHAPFIEDIPAYIAGALDAAEVAALEAHLETCASCRAELAGYGSLGQSLLMAVPPKQPSAQLRRNLQSRLPSAQKASRPRVRWSFWQLTMGVAVLALLVLNLVSVLQMRQIRSQQAKLLNEVNDAQTALGMLSSNDVQMININGELVSGKLLLGDNQAVLILEDLPSLNADQVYQMWLVKPDGGRVSAGVFRPESGQTYTTEVLSSQQMLSNFTGIGVTVEPAGGSDHPTGARIFKVDF